VHKDLILSINFDSLFFALNNVQAAHKWFTSRYTPITQIQQDLLVTEYGYDWPMVGRDGTVKEVLQNVEARFANFRTVAQIDKVRNAICFIGSIPGGGKSKLNQEMLPAMQKIIEPLSPMHKHLQHAASVFVTFVNGTSLSKKEIENDNIDFAVAIRMLYNYFKVHNQSSHQYIDEFGFGRSTITDFENFVKVLRYYDFSISFACEIIAHDMLQKNPNVIPIIYLAIDEFQLMKDLKKSTMQELVKTIGNIMCAAQTYFLVPFFTGTEYSIMDYAIIGSGYRTQASSFRLITNNDIYKLFDELASDKKYNLHFLKYWRCWKPLRRCLDDFQGLVRGVASFILLLSNQCKNIEQLTHQVQFEEYMSLVSNINVYDIFNQVRNSEHVPTPFKTISNIQAKELLTRIVLELPVLRTENFAGTSYTYETLEKSGAFVLEPAVDQQHCIIRMPYVIFTHLIARFPSFCNYSVFTKCEWWQEWETFTMYHSAFLENMWKIRQTLQVDAVQGPITVKDYYKGAKFSSATGNVTVPLAPGVNEVTVHQISSQFPNASNTRSFPENVLSYTTVVKNGASAPYADVFKVRPGFIEAIQCKSVTKGGLNEAGIEKELKMNNKVFKNLLRSKVYKNSETCKSPTQITVIRTHCCLNDAAEIAEKHLHLVIVSKDQFRAFYGSILADRAWFAACMFTD